MTSMATSAAMVPSSPEGSSRFESLRLTKKERELLSVLMQNQGRCISRELLLKTVWKYCEGAKTRTVDVHIQRLRQKLGSQGAACIKTIVRAGYCWLPDPEAAVKHS